LAELAERADASVVYLDSLKDAAVGPGLSDGTKHDIRGAAGTRLVIGHRQHGARRTVHR